MVFSKAGDPFSPGQEPEQAPGVRGMAFDTPEGIYLSVISADRPGTGDVGRFLDGLPRDRRVAVTTVMSSVLEGMLLRRGFVHALDDGMSVMERVP